MATRGLGFVSLAGSPIGFRTAVAAGSTQADATALQSYSGFAYKVTGANAVKGIKLPVANAGTFIVIKNDDAANASLLVYPFLGGSINGAAANTAFSIGAGGTAWFMGATGTTWVVIATASGGSSAGGAAGTVAAVTGLSGADAQGAAGMHQTTFTLNAMPLLVRDAQQGNGVQIFTFPEGVINLIGASGSVAETTTSVLASTLHASVTYNWGVGSVTQSTGTLATTQQDYLPTTNGTSSATINVAGAASPGARVTTGAYFDGTAGAKVAFFNVGIATGTDIDADATTLWSGTINLIWQFLGDK